jgi:hypothetical protein
MDDDATNDAPPADDEPDGSAREDLADLTSELGPPAELGTFPLMDAILLAGHLRSVGIPAMSESDSPDSPFRLAPGMSGESRVFVRPEDLARARDESRRIAEGAGDDADEEP